MDWGDLCVFAQQQLAWVGNQGQRPKGHTWCQESLLGLSRENTVAGSTAETLLAHIIWVGLDLARMLLLCWN